jgi:hypothetical protein
MKLLIVRHSPLHIFIPLSPNIRLSILFLNNLSVLFSLNLVVTAVEMVMAVVINTLESHFIKHQREGYNR